jgi:carbonic anhydrase
MRTKLWLTLVLCLTLGCAGGGGDHHAHNSDDAHAAHWGYGEGDGPDRWSSLKGDWALCASGTAQSPIDLHGTEDASDLERMALDLPEASLRVIRQEHVLHPLNNGHTIQVNVDAGDTLTIGDQSFDLQQYHFHSPSEHTVNGTHYPMPESWPSSACSSTRVSTTPLSIRCGATCRPSQGPGRTSSTFG